MSRVFSIVVGVLVGIASPAAATDHPAAQPASHEIADARLGTGVRVAADGSFAMTPERVRFEPTASWPAARPTVLPGLYVSLAVLNGLDWYTTSRGLQGGAREANPAMASAVNNRATFIAVKAATSAATILLADRLWKQNRAAAIILMVAANGATAAIVAHNAGVISHMR